MIRIATRKSALAKWQAEHIAERLRQDDPTAQIELHEVVTRGDQILDVPLARVGGKGLFVKEIEEALLAGQADVAVHSMKDLPGVLSDELDIAAIPEREDARDALCGRGGHTFVSLPKGARVGTSSLRRASQIRALRPDLEVVPVRGNVGTRLEKLEHGLDAVVLAYAGLIRLGLASRVTYLFSADEMVPAVAQGALAVQARRADFAMRARLAKLDHAETRICTTAERAFLTRLQGGCQVPIAARAELHGGMVRMRGLVASIDGRRVVRAEQSGPAGLAKALGTEIAETILARGGEAILREVEGMQVEVSLP